KVYGGPHRHPRGPGAPGAVSGPLPGQMALVGWGRALTEATHKRETRLAVARRRPYGTEEDESMQAASTSKRIGGSAPGCLSNKRIAVTGVSRHPQDHGSNTVYKRLRERGYEVFAVNPNADQVEGDTCYHDLRSIPGGVGAVVIGTRPERAEATMRECAELGIKHVWMHRGPGAWSVSAAACAYRRQQGISVIPR